jgi:hypothetical protein
VVRRRAGFLCRWPEARQCGPQLRCTEVFTRGHAGGSMPPPLTRRSLSWATSGRESSTCSGGCRGVVTSCHMSAPPGRERAPGSASSSWHMMHAHSLDLRDAEHRLRTVTRSCGQPGSQKVVRRMAGFLCRRPQAQECGPQLRSAEVSFVRARWIHRGQHHLALGKWDLGSVCHGRSTTIIS